MSVLVGDMRAEDDSFGSACSSEAMVGNTMTQNNKQQAIRTVPLSRRNILRATGTAGALAVGGVGLGSFTGLAGAVEHDVIETCGGDVDIVVALDYSGSIANAGTWGDIQDGTESFLGVVPDDVQLGLVTFGDSPAAFEYGTTNLLDFATATNVTTVQNYVSGLGTPPGENATHMPGALAFANAILEEEGRGGKEIVILITDGGPNYQNGIVGDGASPPADDTMFPYGNFEFTGGTSGGENGIAGESGELTETSSTATEIKDAGRRIIAVGVGQNVAGFDDYLADDIASTPDDFVPVTNAENLGSELRALITEVCEECVDCTSEELLAKYEFDCVETEVTDEEAVCVDYDFVFEKGDASLVSYDGQNYVSKEDEMFEPVSATFGTEYCSVWGVVKAGQEFIIQELEAENGTVTVTNGDSGRAISFVAFFCTEAAAAEFVENFPSRGRGSNR